MYEIQNRCWVEGKLLSFFQDDSAGPFHTEKTRGQQNIYQRIEPEEVFTLNFEWI